MDDDQPIAAAPEDERLLAILAEGLYLANLLIMPLISFLWLALLNYRYRHTTSRLARCHLRQTLTASLWAGALLFSVTTLTIALSGYDSITTWTVIILYFTIVHSTFVLLGMVGLTKAMASQPWRFPLIGPRSGECR